MAPNQQADVLANANIFHSFEIKDLRAEQHFVQINTKEKKETLVNSSQDIKQIIKNSLLARLSSKNSNLNGVSYRVNIQKLLITVDQHSLKYESNSELALQVVVEGDGKMLSKTFKRNGNNYGPLKADLAILERDFNLLLGQMLDDISTDPELNNAIVKQL